MRVVSTLCVAALLLTSLVLSTAHAAPSPRSTAAVACSTTSDVSLVGMISTHHEYGPPGWGETPKQDYIWTMVLLKVSGSTSKMIRELLPSCFNASDKLVEVQLWSKHGPLMLSKYRGKRVRVSGKLSAHNGPPAELRAAQMWVTTVSLLATVPNNSFQRTRCARR
jgi:hypothetical protein